MDPGVKARRIAIARHEIEEAALILANQMGLQDEVDGFLAARSVPAAAREVYQFEATAALLKALVSVDSEGLGLPGDEPIPPSDANAAVSVDNLLELVPTLTRVQAQELYDVGFDAEQGWDAEALEAAGVGPATIHKLREALPDRERVITDAERIEEAVGAANAERLRDGGYDTIDSIMQASDPDLNDVDQIGPATIQKLRDAFGVAGDVPDPDDVDAEAADDPDEGSITDDEGDE